MARVTEGSLTDVQLRHWKTKGQPLAKSDGGGLTFTVSANGTASWILRYRIHGRRKEITLGNYPGLSAADARKAKCKHLALIADGTDVALEKQRTKNASIATWTVRQLADNFSDKVLSVRAAKTAEVRRLYLRKDILPTLGGMRAVDVKSSDIVALLDKVAVRGHIVAQAVKVTATALFKHACGLRILEVNPVKGIDLASLVAPKPARPRVKLTDAELRAFLSSLAAVPEHHALAFRILLATGVRIGELLSAEWRDINLDASQWHIPRAKKKERGSMKASHFTVALAPAVLEWFSRLQVLACGSQWVLPSRDTRRQDQHQTYQAVHDALERYHAQLGEHCRRWTPHDARSTMRSHLSALGIGYEVKERALNHKLPGLAEVYDAHEYLDERADALNRWASVLVALESGTTPFKRKAI